MKPRIVSMFTLLALGLAAAQAAEREPGSPGTPTPTPYPQVNMPAPTRNNGLDGAPPLLPPIPLPTPPREQPLPQLDRAGENPPVRPKSPGG